MKILAKSVLLAFATAISAAFAQAEVQTKVIVVDVAKAFQGYYGLKDRAQKVIAVQKRAQEEADRRKKDLEAAQDKYNQLVEQAKSPILKDDARATAEKDAEKQLEELRKMDGEFRQWVQQAQEAVGAEDNSFKMDIVKLIRNSAVEIFKKRGGTILLDRSAISPNGLEVTIAVDSSADITDEVIADINKGLKAPTPDAAPAAAAPAAAAPATTTPAAPAGDAPAVSFPGVKK